MKRKKASSVSVSKFKRLSRPSSDGWVALRREFPEFVRALSTEAFYGLPDPLLDALKQESPGFLTDRELQFERALASYLKQNLSIGVIDGKLVASSLFDERAPVTVRREDVEALGWEQFGLTFEKANPIFREIESRALSFHEQLIAYAGWLVTNPAFIEEVTALREREQSVSDRSRRADKEGAIREMNEFLNRWQLAGMTSWDLPEPQGPHLAGIDFPALAQRGAAMISLRLPLSARLPAAFPIREVVAEIRNDLAADHLTEWVAILGQERKSSMGLQRFRHILHVQFFRNIVLASRYAERFSGSVAALDRAFGRYLGQRGEDSAKRVRLAINRRLRQAQEKNVTSVVAHRPKV